MFYSRIDNIFPSINQKKIVLYDLNSQDYSVIATILKIFQIFIVNNRRNLGYNQYLHYVFFSFIEIFITITYHLMTIPKH